LDAKLLYYQTFGEMPENPEFPLPEEAKELVAHAMLKVGETDLMFSDTFPGQSSKIGDQVTICITTNDIEKSKQIFESLKQDGQVNMPLQETFFSPAYGIDNGQVRCNLSNLHRGSTLNYPHFNRPQSRLKWGILISFGRSCSKVEGLPIC
jgi:PhnB protein